MNVARALLLIACVGACARAASSPAPAPPSFLLGTFEDDYNSRYTITAQTWDHGTRSRYHIIRWDVAGQFLIARNDSANPGDKGLWTRIDWVPLSGMPPYAWGYCYSAFNAPSAAVAETVSVAKRATPRTGCNGFPFSRMRPAASPVQTP
jgi:hypothetical protein